MKKEIVAAEVFPPGEYIREELEERGWAQADLAQILGRPIQMVNEIITAKKAITPATARELGAAFGTSPKLFLQLENAFRLSKAKKQTGDVEKRARLYELVPVRELVKRKWIAKTKNVDRLEADICQLLGIASIDENPMHRYAARMSTGYQTFSPGQRAWLARCRQLARKKKPKKEFDPRIAGQLVPALPTVYSDETTLSDIPKKLAEIGILIIFLKHLPGTKIDGAAFWHDGMPVVAMSLRYDRIDWFWFTIMHELAHIILHGKDLQFLDIEIVGPNRDGNLHKSAEESQADNQATEWLIAKDEIDSFIETTKPFYSHARIEQFAKEIGVHPGVVVGQLQFRGEIGWHHSRKFLAKIRQILEPEE